MRLRTDPRWEDQRAYYHRNRIKILAQQKAFRLEHPDALKERQKRYYHQNKEKITDQTRKYLYGCTKEQYNELLMWQDGKCAICRSKMTLSIDHDHKTGKIRGLLCRNCNSGLGFFGESIETLQNAINYVGGLNEASI